MSRRCSVRLFLTTHIFFFSQMVFLLVLPLNNQFSFDNQGLPPPIISNRLFPCTGWCPMPPPPLQKLSFDFYMWYLFIMNLLPFDFFDNFPFLKAPLQPYNHPPPILRLTQSSLPRSLWKPSDFFLKDPCDPSLFSLLRFLRSLSFFSSRLHTNRSEFPFSPNSALLFVFGSYVRLPPFLLGFPGDSKPCPLHFPSRQTFWLFVGCALSLCVSTPFNSSSLWF